MLSLKNSLFNLVFVLLLIQAQGQKLANRDCPQRPVLQNFDVSKYAGKWYEIYRYEQPFSFGCHCAQATYTLKDNGNVGVTNCCVRDNSQNCLDATGVISYPDQTPLEAKLNVTFFGPPSPSNYWVLDSDYVNYTIIYLCDNLKPGQSKESFWLLSRTKVLSPEVSEKVEALVDKHFDRNDSVFVAENQHEKCIE